MKLIDKDKLLVEIERRRNIWKFGSSIQAVYRKQELDELLDFINTIEVTDPYEQCIQYQTVKDGIKAYAETYSFNIESLLFNQLTKEQQALWRKEIEQACIGGGDAGYLLARDLRYKENLEVKEVEDIKNAFKSGYELGLNAQKGE